MELDDDIINFNSNNDEKNNFKTPKTDLNKFASKLNYISSTSNNLSKHINPLQKFTHNYKNNNSITTSITNQQNNLNNNNVILNSNNNNLSGIETLSTVRKESSTNTNTHSNTNTNFGPIANNNKDSVFIKKNTNISTSISTNNQQQQQMLSVPAMKSSSNLCVGPKSTKQGIKEAYKENRKQHDLPSNNNKSEVPYNNQFNLSNTTNTNIKNFTKSIQGPSTVNKVIMNNNNNGINNNGINNNGINNTGGSLFGNGNISNNNAFVFMAANNNEGINFTNNNNSNINYLNNNSEVTSVEKAFQLNSGGGVGVSSKLFPSTVKGTSKIDYFSNQKKQASLKRFNK